MKIQFLLFISIFILSCEKEKESEVIPPPELKVEFQLIRPSGYRESDGQIRKTITGGTEPYQITWTIGYTAYGKRAYVDEKDDLFNAISGPYIIKITDAQYRKLIDTVFLATYDTVVSSPYLAAYPGSYWEYSNGSRVECNDYILTASGYYETFNLPSDSIYLPKARWFINYDKNFWTGQILVSEDLERFYTVGDNRNGCHGILVAAVDTSIYIAKNLFENVIIMEEWFGSPDDCFIWLELQRYFCKDIGLVKEVFEDGSSIEIVDYYINAP